MLVVLAVVVLVVSAPLRRTRPGPQAESDQSAGEAARDEVAELEAAREAKYREIRDADLDHRTGKLSDADFQATDSSLRA